jgi:hypothetical protein
MRYSHSCHHRDQLWPVGTPDQAIQLPRRAGEDDHIHHQNWSDAVAANAKKKKTIGTKNQWLFKTGGHLGNNFIIGNVLQIE